MVNRNSREPQRESVSKLGIFVESKEFLDRIYNWGKVYIYSGYWKLKAWLESDDKVDWKIRFGEKLSLRLDS